MYLYWHVRDVVLNETGRKSEKSRSLENLEDMIFTSQYDKYLCIHKLINPPRLKRNTCQHEAYKATFRRWKYSLIVIILVSACSRQGHCRRVHTPCNLRVHAHHRLTDLSGVSGLRVASPCPWRWQCRRWHRSSGGWTQGFWRPWAPTGMWWCSPSA